MITDHRGLLQSLSSPAMFTKSVVVQIIAILFIWNWFAVGINYTGFAKSVAEAEKCNNNNKN